MHVVELNVPEPLLLKVIVLVGVMVVPAEVSETVAVHTLGTFTGSGEEHVTITDVERFETVRLKLPVPVE